MVKNLLELKSARRVTIEGNIFENCWGQAQAGYAIVFTVRAQGGAMPWAVVEDVDFVRNIVRNSSGGVNILGRDYNCQRPGNRQKAPDQGQHFRKHRLYPAGVAKEGCIRSSRAPKTSPSITTPTSRTTSGN